MSHLLRLNLLRVLKGREVSFLQLEEGRASSAKLEDLRESRGSNSHACPSKYLYPGFLFFINFYCSTVALQCFVSFCCTAK